MKTHGHQHIAYACTDVCIAYGVVICLLSRESLGMRVITPFTHNFVINFCGHSHRKWEGLYLVRLARLSYFYSSLCESSTNSQTNPKDVQCGNLCTYKQHKENTTTTIVGLGGRNPTSHTTTAALTMTVCIRTPAVTMGCWIPPPPPQSHNGSSPHGHRTLS